MKLILIGIQGAGKSTQGNVLSKQLSIPYLSTGHIFRQMATEHTKWGRYVKETINAGILIPDKETLEIVQEYLSRPEYKNGYILDGFPRNLKQAKEFQNGLTAVIYLKVPDKEALWRIAGRNENRADDTIAGLKKRIEIFHEKTEVVIDFYREKGLLIEVDGTKSITAINEEILRLLGKRNGKNGLINWKRKEKAILAVVGLAGAGKTEATQFFRSKGLPVVGFNKIINSYIDEHKLEHTEAVHKKLRIEFREKYGMEAMAVLSKDKVAAALKKAPFLVIESLYSWEEYLYLKKQFPKVHIYLLAIYADKQLRYKRVNERSYRKGLGGEERDLNELTLQNKGNPIAYADFLVLNNGSIDELHDKLEEVYRQVYFGLR
ncbi:MAG: nucleoside monophosphate kinase [Candidatus Roizmanbacteria bacterium]|nr:nucleoside monophosphate kinase [Candidatus Roizmanbacteria bacterium]